MSPTILLVSLALLTGRAFAAAQTPPSLPPSPATAGLVIPLPEGMALPPADAGPEAYGAFVEDVFFAIAGDDGLMSADELKDWMRMHGIKLGAGPRPDSGGAQGAPDSTGSEAGDSGPRVDFSILPDPPPCTSDLVSSESVPQGTGQPCGATTGNLVFRTVCNADGFSMQSITVPEGRTAACFGIEAITKNSVIVYIYPEEDPSNVVYDSDRDGLERIGDVQLTDPGTYRLELDMDRSDADARVTVRFVSY